MHLIGEPSRFAVGYELDVNHGGAWMYGKFCYFCNGQEVGHYKLGTSLRDVLFQLDEVAKFKHQASPRFSSMSAREIFEILDAALFGETIPRVAELAEEEQWRNFCIFPQVDIFDNWKGFLLDDGKIERLIFSSAPYVEVKELELDSGEVDLVLDRVRKELNEIHERESK